MPHRPSPLHGVPAPPAVPDPDPGRKRNRKPDRPIRSQPRPAALVVATTLTVLCTLLAPIQAAADTTSGHVPPVAAPVVDPFREPTHPYGPGNRGVDFQLDATAPVRASAGGEVAFAGQVGGAYHVTIAHPDGLRTSYSFVSSVGVRVGERVDQGDVIAHARGQLHFGVRTPDGRYLDPALLFGHVETRVRLIPHHETVPDAGASIRHEHAHLLAVVAHEGRGSSVLGRISDAVFGALRSGFEALGRFGAGAVDGFEGTYDALLALADAIHDLGTLEVVVDVLVHVWRAMTRDCTAPGAAVDDARRQVAARTGDRRVALLVGGYGSSSASAAIDDLDTAALGYGADEVLRFSYAGGVTPGIGGAGALAELAANEYRPADTDGDIMAAGADLAALIRQIHQLEPDVVVDVYAHSMGGLTARTALEHLDGSGDLAGVGHVVTIGTPHQGSDLANAAVVLTETADLVAAGVHVAGDLGGGHLDPGATSVGQMADGSSFLRERARHGIPDGVAFLAIGHRSDLAVAADQALVEGEDWAIVDEVDGMNSHAALPGLDATTDEIALALTGAPPVCDGFWNAFADIGYAGLVSFSMDLLTVEVAVFGMACRWCSTPDPRAPSRTPRRPTRRVLVASSMSFGTGSVGS